MIKPRIRKNLKYVLYMKKNIKKSSFKFQISGTYSTAYTK